MSMFNSSGGVRVPSRLRSCVRLIQNPPGSVEQISSPEGIIDGGHRQLDRDATLTRALEQRKRQRKSLCASLCVCERESACRAAMADIALLVVEEFERGIKRGSLMMRRGSQEPPAGDGDGCDRPASAFGRSKQSAWAPAAGAGVARAETGGALGMAAADGFFSA